MELDKINLEELKNIHIKPSHILHNSTKGKISRIYNLNIREVDYIVRRDYGKSFYRVRRELVTEYIVQNYESTSRSELANILDWDQSTLSRHIRKMKQSGILNAIKPNPINYITKMTVDEIDNLIDSYHSNVPPTLHMVINRTANPGSELYIDRVNDMTIRVYCSGNKDHIATITCSEAFGEKTMYDAVRLARIKLLGG